MVVVVSSKAPVEMLQTNAESFFDSVLGKQERTYSCKKGCSQCCNSKFSIFISESKLIEDWFFKLSEAEKRVLEKLWLKGENQDDACAFLAHSECSIYSVRPTICRTQGLPLYLKSTNELDICPLNDLEINLSDKNDWLDLERLNALLAITCPTGERIELSALRERLLFKS